MMIETYWASWLMLVGVFAVAVVAPGPDFVMSVRNSLLHGRRAGVMTALGFGLGVAVHATYAAFGLGAIISHSILLFSAIKYAGAAYLIYIGLQALRSKGASLAAVEAGVAEGNTAAKTDMSALRDGFLTNLLNPKATLFFVALFTQLVSPDTPGVVLAVYALTCCVMVAGWFSLVALLMTQPPIRARYVTLSARIDRVFGLFLLGFGVKLALSKA